MDSGQGERRLNDRVFLKLARKVGYPSPRNVARIRKLQLERSKKGAEKTLFELAHEEDVWSAKERRNYDRWAEQIGKKLQAALVEDDEDEVSSGTLSGRVIAASAVGVIEKDDEEAGGDLDEII